MAYIELRRFMQTTFREKAMGALSYLNGLGCMAGILVGAGGAQLLGLAGLPAALWTVLCIGLGIYLSSERHGVLIVLRWRLRVRYWARWFLGRTVIDGRHLVQPVETVAAPEPAIGVVLQDGTLLFEPVRDE